MIRALTGSHDGKRCHGQTGCTCRSAPLLANCQPRVSTLPASAVLGSSDTDLHTVLHIQRRRLTGHHTVHAPQAPRTHAQIRTPESQTWEVSTSTSTLSPPTRAHRAMPASSDSDSVPFARAKAHNGHIGPGIPAVKALQDVQAVEEIEINRLAADILATAQHLHTQVTALDALFLSGRARETVLLRQRAELEVLLRTFTSLEMAEVRATAALEETLALADVRGARTGSSTGTGTGPEENGDTSRSEPGGPASALPPLLREDGCEPQARSSTPRRRPSPIPIPAGPDMNGGGNRADAARPEADTRAHKSDESAAQRRPHVPSASRRAQGLGALPPSTSGLSGAVAESASSGGVCTREGGGSDRLARVKRLPLFLDSPTSDGERTVGSERKHTHAGGGNMTASASVGNQSRSLRALKGKEAELEPGEIASATRTVRPQVAKARPKDDTRERGPARAPHDRHSPKGRMPVSDAKRAEHHERGQGPGQRTTKHLPGADSGTSAKTKTKRREADRLGLQRRGDAPREIPGKNRVASADRLREPDHARRGPGAGGRREPGRDVRNMKETGPHRDTVAASDGSSGRVRGRVSSVTSAPGRNAANTYQPRNPNRTTAQQSPGGSDYAVSMRGGGSCTRLAATPRVESVRDLSKRR
ncbi:hypothetical protein C8Q74DRAFT_330044 [Fomes fomentarius]|nr:hypothetical protein C8Q74DRAFT_330044 [Fomes fomentarius]